MKLRLYSRPPRQGAGHNAKLLSQPSSYKIMGHAGDKIREVLYIIRSSLVLPYEKLLECLQDDGFSYFWR